MNAIVIGADRLGNIPGALSELGIRIVHHVSGRLAAHQRRLPCLAKDIHLLILFTDFLGHNVMHSYRSQAQSLGIPVVACRRSASSLIQSLQRRLSNRDGENQCQTCPPGR